MTDDTTTPPAYQATAYTQLSDLYTALSKAQGELKHAPKDLTNPHFRSRYAGLASVIDSYRKVFAKHGLSVIQRSIEAEGGVRIQTVIGHSSGQFIADGGIFVPASKNDAHGYGAAVTYARRFGLSAMVGIAPDDDDDGNAAVAAQQAPTIRAKASIEGARARAVSLTKATNKTTEEN